MTLKIGQGWLASRRHFRLKDIRSIQPKAVDEDRSDCVLYVVEWNFVSTLLTAAMPSRTASDLADLLVTSINEKLQLKTTRNAMLVTQGEAHEDDANYAAELLRPPPQSRAVLIQDDGALQVEVPVRLFGRSISGLSTAAVLMSLITGVGWLLSVLSGNWNLKAYSILGGLTALTLLITVWAWRNFATGYVIRFDAKHLDIIARRPWRDRVDQLPYDTLTAIEHKNEDGVHSLRLHRSHGRRRQLLNGQPEEELVWLHALLQHVTGLDAPR